MHQPSARSIGYSDARLSFVRTAASLPRLPALACGRCLRKRGSWRVGVWLPPTITSVPSTTNVPAEVPNLHPHHQLSYLTKPTTPVATEPRWTPPRRCSSGRAQRALPGLSPDPRALCIVPPNAGDPKDTDSFGSIYATDTGKLGNMTNTQWYYEPYEEQ